jgi:hypothetical protein
MSIWEINTDSDSYDSDDEYNYLTINNSDTETDIDTDIDTENYEENNYYDNNNLSDTDEEYKTISPIKYDKIESVNYKANIMKNVKEELKDEYLENGRTETFEAWLKLPNNKKKSDELFEKRIKEYKSKKRISNNIGRNNAIKLNLEKKFRKRIRNSYRREFHYVYNEIDNYNIYQIVNDDKFLGLLIIRKEIILPNNIIDKLVFVRKPNNLNDFINRDGEIMDDCPDIYFHNILNNGVINVKRNVIGTFDIDYGFKNHIIGHNNIIIIESKRDIEKIDISVLNPLL